MAKQLTKEDFTQVDSEWICVVDKLKLSLGQDELGDFKLTVNFEVAPIPAATQYPTEPEWDEALKLANEIINVYGVTSRRDQS